jgi:hypothetical protein
MGLCELPAVHNMKLPLQVFHFLALIGASISFFQEFCSYLTCILFLRFTELGQAILTSGFKLILVDLSSSVPGYCDDDDEIIIIIIILEVF